MTDYYGILGVDNNATDDEIKKAYRKKARKLHPDINPSDEAAEEFKKVTVAYEVLSSPEKRRIVDAGGDPNSSGGPGGYGPPGAGFGGFQDIFETLFGQTGGHQGPIPRTRPGDDQILGVAIDLKDAVFGTEKEITLETAIVCPTCNGNCSKKGSTPQRCSHCGGNGQVHRRARSLLGDVVTATACPVCRGYGDILTDECPDCNGEGRIRSERKLKFRIPAGVQTGQRIHLAGQGEVGPGGGPQGDLYIEIRERTHPEFTRRGDDLHCTLNIPMTAAALGATIDVDTFDGPEAVEIAAGTQSGETVKLSGLGVQHLHTGGRGDLHVHINVQVPTKLDERQRELLNELAEVRGEQKPTVSLSSASGGMFSRLREKLGGR